MPSAKPSKTFRGTRCQNPKGGVAENALPNATVPQVPPTIPDPAVPLTASQSKIRPQERPGARDGGNRLIDVDNMVDFVQGTPCSMCLKEEGFEVREKKMGLSSTFTFRCKACTHERVLKTSKDHLHNGESYAEINTRVVAGALAIGKNYTTISKFLAYLNLPPLMAYRFWQKQLTVLDEVYQEAAEESMQKAADEERPRLPVARDDSDEEVPHPANEVHDITCSCDGTWQKRGFSSHNGVCTVLTATGKVLDVEVMSTYCNYCAKQKKTLNEAHFTLWKRNHVEQEMCDCNHEGSAGAMESAGMLRIFRRSVPKRRLRYVKYLGDGDSKTFKSLCEAQPPLYPGTTIAKLECTGHVQKRARTKLNSVISQCSSRDFINDVGKKVKGIGGRNGITEWHVRRIQGHYGAAIRNNAGNLQNMTAAVWSIYYHRRGDHSRCGNDCPAVSNNDLVKANIHRLPNFVMDQLLPAFEHLADESLLSRCVHGGTQNSNEAFHHLIWERCPKTNFATLRRLRLAVNGAIVTFNDGELCAVNVLRRLGITNVGFAANMWAWRCDRVRLKQSIQQSAVVRKENRKRKVFARIAESGKMRKEEGQVYASGAGFE
jgi:hypothetical protein